MRPRDMRSLAHASLQIRMGLCDKQGLDAEHADMTRDLQQVQGTTSGVGWHIPVTQALF